MKISVIICTHNPLEEYLKQVLEALNQQNLPKELWELLVVDNASKEDVSVIYDLAWHNNARHIREDNLGLTPARLRGIKESVGDLLVFVDDDNVLSPNYLETVINISNEWPKIGIWGSGRISPIFEKEPEEWTKPYWGQLAIRNNTSDYWSNLLTYNDSYPCGAGLCIRKECATEVSKLFECDVTALSLDRKGSSLSSCGDSHMVFLTVKSGYGSGVFVDLELKHLIPSNRITLEYLLNLSESINYTSHVMNKLQGKNFPTRIGLQHYINKLFKISRIKGIERKFLIREYTAFERFLKESAKGQ